MSLFKVRDWWRTDCGNNDEQFDQGCLCLCNVNGSSTNFDKIVVGSFSGLLRVFSPGDSRQEDEGNSSSPTQAESLLLETQLPAPILQITAGRFVSSSENVHLAILHPRKLSVYGLLVTQGSVDHGTSYRLALIYEHNLQRGAYRLVSGPFGKVKGRDFMCVLSLDGTVSFFEQESFSFSRFLPNPLLPGPLAYVGRTDSFVTVSSSYQLECYKYQALAIASSSDKNENQSSGKKVTMDWCYNLGECALDISVIASKNCPPLIYVLGEHHLFCVKDSGALKFVKKFEFQPSCFHVYHGGDKDASILAMVATHSGTLLVYQDVVLKWTSQLPVTPVQISRVNLRNLQGGIVLLSDDGQLICCFLGTNPSVFQPPPMESREINYRETDKEMVELYRIIKASQKSGAPLSAQSDSALSLNVVVPKEPAKAAASAGSNSPNGVEGQACAPNITLKIELQTVMPLQDVQVACHFESSFLLSQSSFHVTSVDDFLCLFTTITLREGFIPSTLVGTVAAVYKNLSGCQCLSECKVTLPLSLAVSLCSPQKGADFKETIGSNKPALKLEDVFPEFVDPSSNCSSQAFGFKYHSGPIVTILVAKTSQRYRLQSDSFEAMSLLAAELLNRLDKWFRTMEKNSNFVPCFSNALPVQEFYFVVNKHFQNRLMMISQEKRLSQLAAQFRAIQKRLLFKYKDKSTAPISNLDSLLESTYAQIQTTADSIEAQSLVMKRSLCGVTAAAGFLCLTIKLYANMSQQDYDHLRNAMCPPLGEEFEQGWEELVCANLSYLQRTIFANSDGHLQQDTTLSMPEDISELKMRVSSVIDYFSKGSVTERNDERLDEGDELDELASTSAPAEPIETLRDTLPIGSRFGEGIKASRTLQSSVRKSQLGEPAETSDIVTDNHVAPPIEENGPTNKYSPNNNPENALIEDIITDNLPDIHTISDDPLTELQAF